MYRRTYSNLRDCFSAFAMTYFTMPPYRGSLKENPFIQITHKGAKRQKLIPQSSITLSGSTGIISAVAMTRRHPKRLNSNIVYSYSFDLSTILIKIYSCLRFTRHCVNAVLYLAFPIGEGGNKRNAQLTEEVKQRNFYIYAYSIKLSYMTSIGTPCHFPR